MNQKIRIKKLLNKVKKKYDLKGRVDVKIIKTETKRGYKPLIVTNSLTKIPTMRVYPNNTVYKFEKIPDKRLEHVLAQELIHCLIGGMICKKEKNPKDLREIVCIIDHMIDHAWIKNIRKHRKTKKKR